MTVERCQKADLLPISDHCQEPFLSCPAMACAVFAVRQIPKCPELPQQKLDVSHAGSLSRGFPSWKRAWSLVPDNPKPAFLILFFKTYLFLERREGRERNVNVWLPPMRPLPGKCSDWESNRQPTRNPWVHKPVLNPLSHTSQACSSVFVVIHPKADT